MGVDMTRKIAHELTRHGVGLRALHLNSGDIIYILILGLNLQNECSHEAPRYIACCLDVQYNNYPSRASFFLDDIMRLSITSLDCQKKSRVIEQKASLPQLKVY